ncbi:MAG: S41 family peptidase [Alphaproteobacteria bacterium]|jgi:carboxyl-terminal processing protease
MNKTFQQILALFTLFILVGFNQPAIAQTSKEDGEKLQVSEDVKKDKKDAKKEGRLPQEEVYKLLERFGKAFDTIREEYVEEPSDKELIEAAINGMLQYLDPHSTYLNKESFNEVQLQTKGEFGGLGIEVTIKDGLVYVISPIDDTPAFKAGLKSGDYISNLDGKSVFGMTIKDAVSIMRGKPGSKITITVYRKEAGEPFDVTITRDVIKIQSVKTETYDDIGYIRVSSFSENTSATLEKAIKKLKKDIGPKLKGFVLDLRNNPGGLLNQAIEVSDTFLDKGEIVSTRGRTPNSIKRFNASKGDLVDNLPIVVLINNGSASASEIVAGALKDHGRAIIAGTQSFGKGSVQTISPLSNDTAMKLTTSRYYTPSGISIQAEGIKPDIIINPAKLEFEKAQKSNVEASLVGHLENKNSGKPEEGINLEKLGIKPEGNKNVIEELYKKDYQIARAVEILKSLDVFKRNISNNN